MTRNKKHFLRAVALFLLVSVCLSMAACRTQEATETTGSATKMAYTVTVKSEGGMPLEGLGVYIYTDETLTELESFVKTDAEGKVAFEAVPGSYVAVLDQVPEGYEAEQMYSIREGSNEIVLVSTMGEGDLASIIYKLGDVMQEFTVTDTEGKDYTLSQLLKSKKAVVLNFWYVQCNPCKAEFPYMQEAYDKYSENIALLALNPVNDDDAEIAAFKQELELTMPVAKADPNWEKAMQLTAYPTTVVVDRYGSIAMIHKGSITETETFERIFAFFAADDYVQTTVKSIEELPELEKPGSNADNPIEIGSVRSFEVTVEPGQLVYYHLYRVDQMYLSIQNKDAYAVYNQRTYKANGGSVGFSLSTPDTYTPAQVAFGNTGTETITYTVYLNPLQGTINNPYTLNLGEFDTKVYSGNDQGVYYTYKATEDGLFTIKCLSINPDVKYDYSLYNLNTYAMRTMREDGMEDAEGDDTVSIYARKGNSIQVIVSTLPDSSNSYPAANFTSLASFQAGATEDDIKEEEKFVYAVSVTDEDRKPIAGVVVSMDVDGKTVAMTTNEKGIAYTKQVAGTYIVTMRVPQGYTAKSTRFQLSDTAPTIAVKLDKLNIEMETYTVKVVDDSGAAVPNVLVSIDSSFGSTDENGSASFTLVKGSYTAKISVPSGYSSDATSFAFPDEATELVITLQKNGDAGEGTDPDDPDGTAVTYTVKVVDYNGNGVSNVLAIFGDAMVQTNSSGIATAKLEPGTYPVTLSFTNGTYYYEQDKAVLTADTTSVTITVAKGVAGDYELIYDQYNAYYVDAGGTYVTMQADVVNYYLFAPEEGQDGLYRFTTSDPNAVISYWGGSTFFISDQTADTDYANNAFTRNIRPSNIGATYVIGITGATECVLEITRIGDAILSDDDLVPVEWEGSSTPSSIYTVTGVSGKTMKFVDLTGNAKAVYNAADGYYHLNSADGPILYLATGYLHDASNQRFGSTRWLRLSDAFAVTNEDAVLNFVQVLTDANGNKVKERYNNCMVQYINCADSKYGVYPLTEDLIYMLQQGGDYRGWFDSSNGNYIVPEEERNLSYNADILWMFNCCYFE